MQYGYNKKTDLSFSKAVERIKETLAEEGFGVLWEIDVKETMKKKLGVEYENYLILGACNPEFAHRALQMETKIGLLLPCNAIVYEKDGGVFVSVIKPSAAMSIVENKALSTIAADVEDKLKAAVDAV